MNNSENKLHILYGTRSGNSKMIAEIAENYCKAAGVNVICKDVREVDSVDLSLYRYLWFIVSTHGEGDPPVAVENFYNIIHQEDMNKLPDLKFAVLALGDSNYRNFCQTGIDIDKRLAALGAMRLCDVELIDLDFEFPSMDWVDKNFRLISKELSAVKVGNLPKLIANRTKFRARIDDRYCISGAGSSKNVFHIVLRTGKQNIPFKPGDCVRIICRNSRWMVDEILASLGLNPAIPMLRDKKRFTLKELLINEYEITTLTAEVVKRYAEVSCLKELYKLLNDENALHEYCSDHDALDLFNQFRYHLTAIELCHVLRRLQPRTYSIASGHLSHPEEIQITISWMKFLRRERWYKGVGSSYLSELSDKGDSIEFELEIHDAFHFPESPEIPIIMLATSTGIAPFRSTLLDRQEKGWMGNTWLFFGDRNERSDFLYEKEIKEWLDIGILEKLDTAFSRDQPEKIYLQDQITFRKEEFVEWIFKGANIYLCGTKNTLARDIKTTIVSILSEVKGWTYLEATDYFNTMRIELRYAEDVY
jgi:sulfite reductase (NADPH) flavoprotein alpha-component